MFNPELDTYKPLEQDANLKIYRLLQPHSDIVYNRYARSARFTADTVELAHGSKGHWLGDKTSKNVLIWFHGTNIPLSCPSNILMVRSFGLWIYC